MKELETLLSMDLDENTKKLLNAVNDGVTKLNNANSEMVRTIESKERANADLIEDRKDLRAKYKELEDTKSKTDDKTVQEQLDAINASWLEKYQALEGDFNAVKTEAINKTKHDEFTELNVGTLLHKDWSDIQKKTAMTTIKTLVLDGATYDETAGWVFKENGVTITDTTTGKPLTISGKFEQVRSSGAMDMFIADSSNSGTGETYNQNNGGGVVKKFADYTGAELAQIRANNPAEYDALKQTR